MVRYSLFLSEVDLEILKELSTKDVSVSEIIRASIKEFLDKRTLKNVSTSPSKK